MKFLLFPGEVFLIPRCARCAMRNRGAACDPGETSGFVGKDLPPQWWGGLALAIALFLAVPCFGAPAHERLVVGYVERVRLFPGDLILRAKIDTGAKHSSLNAKNIDRSTRNGKSWVSFSITNHANESITIERPVHRIVTIRRHGGRNQEREVLSLGICLGSVFKEVEVNIIDRTGFNYQMVVGRSFLSGSFVVDPVEAFLLNPTCADGHQ